MAPKTAYRLIIYQVIIVYSVIQCERIAKNQKCRLTERLFRTYFKNKSRHMLENIAYLGDGTYKLSMDPARALYSLPSTQTRWQRTSQEEPKGCSQRHPMGASNWSTLERSAAALSSAPDLPPLVPDLGPAGGVQTDPYRTWRGSLPARGHRYT